MGWGVIIKEMCVGMCFVRTNVHKCAHSYIASVLIVILWMGPMSRRVSEGETKCVRTRV